LITDRDGGTFPKLVAIACLSELVFSDLRARHIVPRVRLRGHGFTCLESMDVQITLTGDPEYGRAVPHSTHNNPPPKEVKFRNWDTIPLWKEQVAKK
jgi:hypothetical protein